MTEAKGSLNVNVYCIYLNKRRGAYKNFHASNAALVRWRGLFERWTRQNIIWTTVLLFSALINYRINAPVFWISLYQARGAYCPIGALIWVNTVFKSIRFKKMCKYNFIFFWASRDEKQFFWTPVSRVVKSSRCQRKSPPTWLLSAGYSAWHFFTDGVFFFNKTSLDWSLTLTTQPSSSKHSDNPA